MLWGLQGMRLYPAIKGVIHFPSESESDHRSCLTLCHPWTVVCQVPLPMEFSRQEYQSGLPCPLPGDLPCPEIRRMSLTSPALAGRFLTTSEVHLGWPTWSQNTRCPGLLQKVRGKVAQSCPALCDPMDYTVRGILQARILEWVIPFSRGSSQTRDQTQVSHIAGEFFTSWATREAQEDLSG